jgi:NAD(P)-dependent dehydrogenase (short-subunit alcohol dehydrogenase family)
MPRILGPRQTAGCDDHPATGEWGNDMQDLAGQVAVITGGGSERGIGRATGTLLAENGVKVVLADLNKEALDTTVEELTAKGHDVIGVPTDVADLSSMQNLANQAFDHFGKVDIAFLNAGIGGGGNLFDDEMDSWNRVIGVNFLGVLHGIKSFVPRMIAQGTHGHVLATSSGAGTTGTMYTGAGYATTKAAVCSLMECLYGQLRDQGADIQATVVFPPLARTNLAGDPAIMDMVAKGLEAGGVPGVLAEPEEVAQVVFEAIQHDNFWAHPTHEQDDRLFNGKFTTLIDWEAGIIDARAAAMNGGSKPDPYLWGGSGAPS